MYVHVNCSPAEMFMSEQLDTNAHCILTSAVCCMAAAVA
jgi:hypothetical protein